MSLKRSHTLYLQSSKRDSGTPSNYIITLPQVIDSDPNLERFKITLQNFSTYNDWYLIKEGSNTIWVNGKMLTVPHGTYTYYRLSKQLATTTGAAVTWLQDQNKMQFSFQESKSVSFDGVGPILGFDEDIVYTGSVIVSDFAMTPVKDTHLFVHLNNVSPLNDHLVFSNHTGEVKVANILAKVLVNAAPFTLITHQQVLESEGLYSNENNLGALEVMITKSRGEEFYDLPDHEMVLHIESVDIDNVDLKEIMYEIKDIKNTLKDIMLMKYLKPSRTPFARPMP